MPHCILSVAFPAGRISVLVLVEGDRVGMGGTLSLILGGKGWRGYLVLLLAGVLPLSLCGRTNKVKTLPSLVLRTRAITRSESSVVTKTRESFLTCACLRGSSPHTTSTQKVNINKRKPPDLTSYFIKPAVNIFILISKFCKN